MQQTFQCYKCGAQNNMGQPHCWNCQAQFQYNCPNCHAPVQGTMVNCPYCGVLLSWPTQQQTVPIQTPQKHIDDQDTAVKHEVKRETKNKRKPWLVGCLIALGILGLLSLFGVCVSSLASRNSSIDANVLIKKDASVMTLTLDDFEAGWVRRYANSVVKTGSISAYDVYYYTGNIAPKVVENIVAVYPDINLAKQVYSELKPKDIVLKDPNIGDEGYLDVSKDTVNTLVFRKNNVVAWVYLMQDMFGDVKQYARMVEKKIIP